MFIINFCLNMFRASLCPKHVEREVDNKHLIVASCWFSLSSHFAHDALSQEPKAYKEVWRQSFILITSECRHFFCVTDVCNWNESYNLKIIILEFCTIWSEIMQKYRITVHDIHILLI